MNILIAPDSFKGSATTTEVGEAMLAGLQKVDPNIAATLLPMADGGEGTMEALVAASHGDIHEVQVHDPLGRPLLAHYGVMGDGQTAVIELASASGITTLTPAELNPYRASTYGTGELMIAALDKGLRHFLICLGGSATNDGASGLLSALGFRFLDADGQLLEQGGFALQKLHTIDTSEVDSRVYHSSFEIACDVTNPLIGPQGASAIFGPQKGATSEMVEQLIKP